MQEAGIFTDRHATAPRGAPLFRKAILVMVSVDEADPLADLGAVKRRTLNSLSFAIVVTKYSYAQCLFVVFNGFMRITAI